MRASAGEVLRAPAGALARPAANIGRMREVGATLLSAAPPPRPSSARRASRPRGWSAWWPPRSGSGAAAFGELVACSRARAAFSGDDLAFVESIANVLMAAVERERAVSDAPTSRRWRPGASEQLNDAQRLAQMGSWETDFASGTHTLSENLREMLAL